MTTTEDISLIAAIASTYQPRHLPMEAWKAAKAGVQTATTLTSPSPDVARKSLPVLAAFGTWLFIDGFEVDLDAFGNQDLVERYIQVGMPGRRDSTRATHRALLRRVARRLDPSPVPVPEPISYRRAKAPYKSWQIAGFFDLAAAQPTAAIRSSMTAILALGLGCGLDRTDLAWVRGIDVTQGREIEVKVVGGSRPRTVIALDEFAAHIVETAQAAGDHLVIGGSTLGRRNVTTPTLDRMVHDASLPRLAPARLRSTWLVTHLNLGTPLSVLLPAAGLASSRTLDDLLEYADSTPADTAASLLAGPRG